MSESRQELLHWTNDLLQLNYTKVEQFGTGAAYCQIFDSIFQDLPLARVKFDTVHEYEYVNNFKVLQKCFNDHQLDKFIPVEKLVKCKMQDNLEFLQWVKKYWDTYYPGGSYDAVKRRRGTSAGKASTVAKKTPPASAGRVAPKAAAAAPMASAAPRQPLSKAALSSNHSAPPQMVQELTKQITQLQVNIDGLEKERDFYFAKLRDIEVFVQTSIDNEAEESHLAKTLKEIQDILYSTEEGFEVPQENQAVDETY